MSNRLYVGNLPFHATESLLAERFASCNGFVSVSLVMDRDTGRSRGFAFVQMASDSAAQEALAELDGRDLEGRSLRVRIAEDRPRDGGGGGGPRGGSRDYGRGGSRGR
ncbi:MAG TPA: RNA-binding protein [Kofleriaceae bacterium]|nr:RNA-binding protein [Kofleriaceae bacterium]